MYGTQGLSTGQNIQNLGYSGKFRIYHFCTYGATCTPVIAMHLSALLDFEQLVLIK